MNFNFNPKSRLLLLILLFTSLSLTLFAQGEKYTFNKQITYQISYLLDSTDQDSGSSELAELLLNDSISLFRSDTKAYKDEEYFNPPKNQMPTPTIIYAGGHINKFNYQILKNSNGHIKVYDEYSGNDLKTLNELNFYTEQMGPSQWTMTEDTLNIMGFNCQKATIEYGGRTWEAYFTVEIPISDGPYKFCGLPGLIVQMNDINNSWSFQLKDIKEIDQTVKINDKKDLKLKEISKEELFSQRRKYKKDQINVGQANNVQDVQKRKDIEEVIKKDNNWIELYP